MNFFRKSSMVLAGVAASGLLAFACAGGNDGSTKSSADEVIQSSTKDLLIAKVYAGGGTSNAGGLAGDYVEIFNPTDHAISRARLGLQLADAEGAFDPAYILHLDDPKDPNATIESGHYFLVSLTPGADLGVAPSLEATPIKLDDSGDATPFALDVAGGSVALLNWEDPLNCDQPANCGNHPNVKSVFGYGKIAGDPPLAEDKPYATALTSTVTAVRKSKGCFVTGSSLDDFEPGDVAPFDPAVGTNCSTVLPPDAGDDASTPDPDAGSTADAGTDAGNEGTPDAGKPDSGTTGKPDAGKKDAAASDDSDDSSDDSGGDGTPAPTTGKKKKTNANTPPQPIASSDSSCAAAPGPMPTSSLAGLAGLGLAVASVVRRKKK